MELLRRQFFKLGKRHEKVSSGQTYLADDVLRRGYVRVTGCARVVLLTLEMLQVVNAHLLALIFNISDKARIALPAISGNSCDLINFFTLSKVAKVTSEISLFNPAGLLQK